MSRRKSTFRSAKRKNTIVQITNEFKQFKKLTRAVFRNKYGNPYLYQYKRVSPTIINPSKWDVPTLFHLNTISGFVSNKDCHYNSFFKEQQIFISNVEYLFKYHTPLESKIKLLSSYQHNVTIIPNFYPQGKEVMDIVKSYHKDIAKYPFQGRKAYFRYTVRVPTIITPMYEDCDLNEDKTVSSFASKNEKKSMINTFDFITNTKQQEEELDMTTDNENESKFFSKSLREKINANDDVPGESISQLLIKNPKKHRDIRTHHNSFESIEQLIKDIQLIENDVNRLKLKPKRKGCMNRQEQKNINESKHSVLLTTIKNEFNKTYGRCNTHYKFKTRKEKLDFYIFNRLGQLRSGETAQPDNKHFEYDNYTQRTVLHHKPLNYFVLKRTSTHFKDEKNKHTVTNILSTYHNKKYTKAQELKKEKMLKFTRQITKPKVVTLQTEQRFHQEWLRHTKESHNHSRHRGISISRTISHKFCELIEKDTLFCKTHDSIINPNQDRLPPEESFLIS